MEVLKQFWRNLEITLKKFWRNTKKKVRELGRSNFRDVLKNLMKL